MWQADNAKTEAACLLVRPDEKGGSQVAFSTEGVGSPEPGTRKTHTREQSKPLSTVNMKKADYSSRGKTRC